MSTSALQLIEARGPAIGFFLKEVAHRAIQLIRKERYEFSVHEKLSTPKGKKELVTSVDPKAQKLIVRSIREHFPTHGIVAEEGDGKGHYFRIECTDLSGSYYWFIDPLDGTKAFVRRQSHGIGTQMTLVCNGRVVAAIVGDVMTQELYYFRPGSEKVHRIVDYPEHELLTIDSERPLDKQYAFLHSEPENRSEIVRKLIQRKSRGGACSGYEVMGGSIGVWAARLWKREVGLGVLPPGVQKPWDIGPVIGISQKLGFLFVYVKDNGALEVFDPEVSIKPTRFDHETLIVHTSRLPELKRWFAIC